MPATLGVIAGIFIAPDSKFTAAQQVILAGALITGIIAVVIALRVLWARDLGFGPNAKQTAEGTYLDPAHFNRAVAGSLALSLDKVSEGAQWKGTSLPVDRDVGAYRSFYDAGVIDAGVIICRSFAAIRALSIRLGRLDGFTTTTTTTIEKLTERMSRGDGGGCPILAVAITDRCYAP